MGGVEAWDCKEDQDVVLRPYIMLLPGDNPMQAEECSHSGLTSNKFCRTCMVGGTQVFKQSDIGFDTIFRVGFTSPSILG